MKILLLTEKVRARFDHMVKAEGACLVWTGGLRNGYGHFKIGGQTYYTHRLIHEAEIGPIPDGLDVCHTCDNRRCVNPCHLFAGTRLENVADAVTKGRHAHGETHGNAKITETTVREIRCLVASGVKQARIAERFGLTSAAVSMIATGKRWGHVS